MTDEAYVKSLIEQFRSSLDAEPYDEELTIDLLDALKKESPDAWRRIVEESGYTKIIGSLD